MIHALKIKYPSIPILLGKYDLDAAYRRIHTALKEACQCITIIDRVAFLLTRLPFGTTPAADCFNTASETVTDLAQKIAEDESWDPSSLHHPLGHKIPDPAPYDGDSSLDIPPFHLIPPVEHKTIHHDVYIDDIMVITLALAKY